MTTSAVTKDIVRMTSEKFGITEGKAAEYLTTFVRRQGKKGFHKGWFVAMIHAQTVTHYGTDARNAPRIKCGHEVNMAYLMPEPGELCHDCGAARGEYHLLECDAEECPLCHGQSLSCGCDLE